MTTNHPEKLDPALIRPGRINKKVYLGRMCLPEARQMVAHYFSADAPAAADMAAFAAAFPDGAMTPAELEELCAGADTVMSWSSPWSARRGSEPQGSLGRSGLCSLAHILLPNLGYEQLPQDSPHCGSLPRRSYRAVVSTSTLQRSYSSYMPLIRRVQLWAPDCVLVARVQSQNC